MLAFRIFEDSAFSKKLRAVPEDEEGIDIEYLKKEIRKSEDKAKEEGNNAPVGHGRISKAHCRKYSRYRSVRLSIQKEAGFWDSLGVLATPCCRSEKTEVSIRSEVEADCRLAPQTRAALGENLQAYHLCCPNILQSVKQDNNSAETRRASKSGKRVRCAHHYRRRL